VKAQELPAPNFSTVKSQNPEEPAVFTLALQQAEAEPPDVIMATDPDADRLGVLARDRQGHISCSRAIKSAPYWWITCSPARPGWAFCPATAP